MEPNEDPTLSQGGFRSQVGSKKVDPVNREGLDQIQYGWITWVGPREVGPIEMLSSSERAHGENPKLRRVSPLMVRDEEANKPICQLLRDVSSRTTQAENRVIYLAEKKEERSHPSRAREETKGKGT